MSRPYEYLDKVASLGSLWRVVCLCWACVLLLVVAIWGGRLAPSRNLFSVGVHT